MTKLYDIEVQLLEQHIVKHNLAEFDRAHFIHILGNIVPHWRGEEIDENDEAYIHYLDTFNDKTNTML